MTQRTFDDPVLELAIRQGRGPEGVLDMADVTDSEAEIVLGVLDDVETDEEVARIEAELRQMGQIL